MTKGIKKVIFISSTGGHLSELLALFPLFSKYDYRLVTEKTPSNADLSKKYLNRCHYLIYGTKKNMIPYVFIFAFNTLKSLFLLVCFRPHAIVTTGTHTAVPMCLFGKLFGVRVIYIETKASFVELSVTGKILLKSADYFIVQHPLLSRKYARSILCEA